jgi:Penicillin binding protein transpeptidase domain
MIWPSFGAVGTVAEVSGSSEDDTTSWDSWFRPRSSDPEHPPRAEDPQPASDLEPQPFIEPQTVVQRRPPGGKHGRPGRKRPDGGLPDGGLPERKGPGSKRPDGKRPDRQRLGRKRRKLPYVLTTAAVVVAAGITAVVVLHGRGPAHTTGFLPTGSSNGQDAQQTAGAFLRAWDAGDLKQAADYTNHPAAARAALTTYRRYLHLSKLTSAAGSAAPVSSGSASPREKVSYAASARVAASDGGKTVSGTWHYHASLVTYRAKQSQYWYVAWAPDAMAPNLTASTHLAAVPVAPRVILVTDASGSDLTSYGDAGLNNIATILENNAPQGDGSPGLDVEIQTTTGKLVPRTQAVVVAPKNVSELATTIDAAAEQAARSAVHEHKNSSMVVIQPSTGKILAVANNAGFNDFALTAAVAPGSTMKTITSTALFTEGVLTPDSDVACPPTFTIQGVTYHNNQGESEPASTPFITDFAQSCNNAFDRQWVHLTNGRLAEAAKEYYGLDQKWNIGLGNISASYFSAPPSASGSELAQEAFGEGELTASPLAMASIAATIDTGSFRQPYIAAGGPRVSAKPLPGSTDSWLKEMMRAVVTSGTAEPIGLGPGIYAKTGTADVEHQGQPNSWFIAFEPSKDVAVACLVVDAGYGASVAGPEVKDFLDSY